MWITDSRGHLAKSLQRLVQQVDEIYPNRSKVSDGSLGDEAHASRKSDHNRNVRGDVTAVDITHDPRTGIGPDTWKLAEILRLNRDPRIKYVISNGRIFSSEKAPWTWREYNGSNKHDKHIHVSVLDGTYEDDSPWDLTAGDGVEIPPRPVEPDELRRSMANAIVSFEDAGARLKVSRLNDGTFEIAGINSRYHEPEARALVTLVEAGKDAEARKRAGDYILQYTDVVREWTKNAGIEFFARDSFFNRGPKGSALIVQRAVGTAQDGIVGPATRAALVEQEQADPAALLLRLRAARELHERSLNLAGELNGPGQKRDESWSSWRGMVNRWNKAEDVAKSILAPQPQPQPQPQPVPPPTPIPQPVPPPAPEPRPDIGTFIENVERIVAQITAEKDEVARAFARLTELAAELKRLTDRGL
jgi:lysozyme family protein